MFPTPPMPSFAPEHASASSARLRFEDVAQDGRLHAIAVPPSLANLWNDVLVSHRGTRNAIAQGVVPILSRLTVHATERAIRVDRPVDVRAGFELAHERDDRGDIARLYMNVWSEVRGVPGRLGRKEAGEPAVAGTLFAEHTFTRLMAPPEQRRVVELAVDGYPKIPEARHAAQRPDTARDAPAGARWLDELAPDPVEHAFTLDQTDQDQHVNSLVYVRVFLDAVNRRLAASEHARGGRTCTRAFDIAYRKPAFAGDRVRVHVRLFALGELVGAAGFVAPAVDDPAAKPHCYARAIISA